MDARLEQICSVLDRAGRITLLTGAGVSAASGVPTFRGTEGLWRQFKPEELATPAAFRRDPRLVWEWYAWRRERVGTCQPNAAHEVIARWSQQRDCRVITQNVDDLHVRAGTTNLVRLHGSIWEMRCAGDRRRDEVSACGHTTWRDERVPLDELPPRCPACHGLARPAIVWFGEPLSPADLDDALEATQCDVFVTIGTSAVVYPAAGLVHEAHRRGATTVEINTEPTPATPIVNLAIHGAAEIVLPAIDERLRHIGGTSRAVAP